jgi:hypothetical protein
MLRAVLDADVLYALPLRDTLLSAAEAGCFQPVWSDEILDEMARNLVKDGRASDQRAALLRAIMDDSFKEARVTGFGPLIDLMPNHPKDRHVAACAVAGEASLIVTNNLKDFTLLPAGIAAIGPGAFLCLLLERTPAALALALEAQILRLRNPPMTLEDLLARYETALPQFVSAWRARTGG